jgi:rhomboid-like protein
MYILYPYHSLRLLFALIPEMSNVSSITWRIPCWGLRVSSSSLLSNFDPVWTRIRPFYTFPCNVHRPLSSYLRPISPLRPSSYLKCNNPQAKEFFPCLVVRSVQTKNASSLDPEKKSPVEDGVPISSRPLSASEINSIFRPSKVSPTLGNRILNVLQGRRLKGTLDLDLPADIVGTVRPQTIEVALDWLRKNRPVDEDAAVMARVEREEQEEEEKTVRHIEKLGLDKPQSGFYGAELGQGNDIYGRSVLKDAREYNEAKFIEEEEKRRKEWMEGEAKNREHLRQQLKQSTGLQKYDEAAAAVEEGMLAITSIICVFRSLSLLQFVLEQIPGNIRS